MCAFRLLLYHHCPCVVDDAVQINLLCVFTVRLLLYRHCLCVVDDAVQINLAEAQLNEVHLRLANGQSLDTCQITRNDMDDDEEGECVTIQCQSVLETSGEIEEEEDIEEEVEVPRVQGGQFIEVGQFVQLVNHEAGIVHLEGVDRGDEEGVEMGEQEEGVEEEGEVMVEQTELMAEVVDGTEATGLTGEVQEGCLVVMAE